jgi:hypothetical protein
VLVARSEGKLRELAEELQRDYKVEAVVLPADLEDPKAPQTMVDRLEQDGLQVDVLVNNAGFGCRGDVVDNDPGVLMGMLQVNVMALTALTRLLLPGMKSRRRGRVMNVASTAAFQPGPGMAGYYASKAYVLSFSEAVDYELRGTGVTVTTLCPGPTHTGFAERGGVSNSPLFDGPIKVMDAASVAAIGYQAMQRGQRLVICGHRNTFMAWSTRFAPRWLLLYFVRRIH